MPRLGILEALCAFADHLAALPDPRDPRGVRHALPVFLTTLLVELAGGAFTHDHQAWFRLWLPLGKATPSRDTYLRLVQRLDPKTAVKDALRLLDGTNLSGLRKLVLALDGKVVRRSGDRALRQVGTDCVLAFKRNLYREVKAAFDDADREAFAPGSSVPCATTSPALDPGSKPALNPTSRIHWFNSEKG
ncbi:MAG: transposase family protein [Caldilineaceae bacterium SB0666_bin_21]|nr:transposase family protein [Caldilineaceae bacterium SB0666_bin_21]